MCGSLCVYGVLVKWGSYCLGADFGTRELTNLTYWTLKTSKVLTLLSTNVDTRASSLSKSRFAASKANSRFRSRASSSSNRSLIVDNISSWDLSLSWKLGKDQGISLLPYLKEKGG